MHLRGDHGQRRADLVRGVLHEGAFALHLLAHAGQERVQRLLQGLELAVAGVESHGLQVVGVALGNAQSQLLQRPQTVAHRQPHGQQHEGHGQQQVGQDEAPVVGQKIDIRALVLDHPQGPACVVAGVDAVRRIACTGLGDHAHSFGC
ncbi:hypothetical protein D9M69_608770 [compost metagenome]